MNVEINPKVGTSIQWQQYKRNFYNAINKNIKLSVDEPYKSLRRESNKTFKLVTVWENWGECNEVAHQKKVRKRIGRCRLQPNDINTTEVKTNKVYFIIRRSYAFKIPQQKS